ncbi:hypothetical protein D3C81_1419400 [compost metagenome]
MIRTQRAEQLCLHLPQFLAGQRVLATLQGQQRACTAYHQRLRVARAPCILRCLPGLLQLGRCRLRVALAGQHIAQLPVQADHLRAAGVGALAEQGQRLPVPGQRGRQASGGGVQRGQVGQ